MEDPEVTLKRQLHELQAPLSGFIKSKSLCKKLSALDLDSVYDLLTHYPRGYYKLKNLSELLHGEEHVAVRAEVVHVHNKMIHRRRMQILEVVLEQDGHQVLLTFFNQPWLRKTIFPGVEVEALGKSEYKSGTFFLRPRSWHCITPEEQANKKKHTILSDYKLPEGVKRKKFSDLISQVLSTYAHSFPSLVSSQTSAKHQLMPLQEALQSVHAPQSLEHAEAGKLSLKFQEFYLLQLLLVMKKRRHNQGQKDLCFALSQKLKERCDARFPFDFTEAQRRVIHEVSQDLASPGRMSRLLQGDVGSGKTAVALYAMLITLANGWQSALMAPTEILARQHYQTITNYLQDSEVKVALLLGGADKKERALLLEELAAGKIHIIIGTHALIQKDVKFSKLGFVVIDEQHKFGVKQRAALFSKGPEPHRLMMSATPIPRTLSLTLYGDLDISVIDELPPGRTPVKTRWIKREGRLKLLEKIRKRCLQGEQAYFIEPLVEPNPELELTSAQELYTELSQVFQELGVELVHGQMNPSEKQEAMECFRSGRSKILIATIVVEVGVDVPAANIMVIEHAERFGLSQLHQLRGRIGRGGASITKYDPSLFLFAEARSEESKERLKTFCRLHDGFEIAEEDLRQRGFGDFIGTRQSGIPQLKFGNFDQDMAVLKAARKAVIQSKIEYSQKTLEHFFFLHFKKPFQSFDV